MDKEKKLLLIDRPQNYRLGRSNGVELLGAWVQDCLTPDKLVVSDFSPYDGMNIGYYYSIYSDTVCNLMNILSKLMPELTGVNVSERFWRFYLTSYIISIVGVYQDAINRRASLVGDYILGCPEGEDRSGNNFFNWKSVYNELFNNDVFRRKVYSQCLMEKFKESRPVNYKSYPKLALTNRYINFITKATYSFNKTEVLCALIKPAKKAARNAFSSDRSFHKEVLFWDWYNINECDIISLGAGLFSADCIQNLKWDKKMGADKKKRMAIEKELPAPYGELISNTLPITALELLKYQVDELKENVLNLFNKVNVVYTFGQAFLDDDPARALFCLLADSGKKVISVQHGGAAYQFDPLIILESSADEYISWGSGYEYGDRCRNIRRLPSIYLSLLKRQSDQAKKMQRRWEVLLVVLEENRFFKYFYNPIFPDLAPDYFKREKALFDFFSNIEGSAVKVYPWSYGWGQSAWIKEKYPNFKLLSSGRFTDFAMRSKIVVIDYNGTTFIEMLAMNRPFLFTWNRIWFKGIERFEESLDKLREVEVFHEHPESLIRTFEQINSNEIDGWWFDEKRQDAIREAAERFALTSDRFEEIWNNELISHKDVTGQVNHDLDQKVLKKEY